MKTKEKKHKSNFNYLSAKILKIMSEKNTGSVLDLGCGNGDSSKKLHDLGFKVTAADMDVKRFEFKDIISFKECNLNSKLPFSDNSFDYIIFLEVIEHIYNPQFVISEISRVLKENGRLIISTPNILNIGSRMRFLFEGSFDFFREPILDYSKAFPMAIQNMHVVPWRYQELEYLLFRNQLHVKNVYTDSVKKSMLFPAFLLKPFLWIQSKSKEFRAKRKGGVDYKRINKILLSKELFLGKHLIIEAFKK